MSSSRRQSTGRAAACLLATSVALAGAAGCGGAGDTASAPAAAVPRFPDRNVVVVVVDCLRADFVGAYGHGQPTTPFIDRLATRSVLFEQAVSASNWTKPSIVSLFTGMSLSQHRATEGHIREEGSADVRAHLVPAGVTTVAEALQAAGFATAGYVNQGHLAGYMGFAQGFDEYDAGLQDGEVMQRFRGFLDRVGEDDRFFTYLHLLNLHFPYVPSERDDVFNEEIADRVVTELARRDRPELQRRMEAGELDEAGVRELVGLYEGNLLGLDRYVGTVVRDLRRRGLDDRTLLVFTADHGEAFYEHGRWGHGDESLYAETVRVPLLVRFPGDEHGGRRVAAPVGTVDVMPTILDYFGLEVPEGLAGRSLLPLVAGAAGNRGPVLAETSDLAAVKALYLDGRKFIFDLRDDSVEVYDYAADPLDQHDLAGMLDPAVIEAARARLDEILASHAAVAATLDGGERLLGAEEVARLRELGYIR